MIRMLALLLGAAPALGARSCRDVPEWVEVRCSDGRAFVLQPSHGERGEPFAGQGLDVAAAGGPGRTVPSLSGRGPLVAFLPWTRRHRPRGSVRGIESGADVGADGAAVACEA